MVLCTNKSQQCLVELLCDPGKIQCNDQPDHQRIFYYSSNKYCTGATVDMYGRYTEDTWSKDMLWLRKDSGVYVLDMLVAPINFKLQRFDFWQAGHPLGSADKLVKTAMTHGEGEQKWHVGQGHQGVGRRHGPRHRHPGVRSRTRRTPRERMMSTQAKWR